MADQQNTVEPVFFNNADMPDHSTSTITVVKAVTGIIDAQYLEGVQKFNHLWRIYFKTLGSREQFLAQKTVLIKGKMVSLHQQSPEEQTEKLTIKGLPLSIGNKEVKDFLLSKNIKPLSRVMYSYIRDDDGARTGFKDGDRFVYCHPLTRYYHVGKQFTDILVQYTVKEETGSHARAVICMDTRQEIIYVQQGKKRVAILMQQF